MTHTSIFGVSYRARPRNLIIFPPKMKALLRTSLPWIRPFMLIELISSGSKHPLLLLLLSRFSHVQLCVTPSTEAHQAPISLGFSRQGHWSGLPFPSPMHESEKWKWSRSVMSDSLQPHGLQPTTFLRPWNSPGKNMEWGASPFSRESSQPGIEPTSPAEQADSLLSEPPGKSITYKKCNIFRIHSIL